MGQMDEKNTKNRSKYTKSSNTEDLEYYPKNSALSSPEGGKYF